MAHPHRYRLPCALLAALLFGLSAGWVGAQKEPPAPAVDLGDVRLSVVTASAVPALKVVEKESTDLLEGRRGFDLLLSGNSPEDVLPALGDRLKAVTDSGEEVEFRLPVGETSREPDGRHFSTRYRLDFSHLKRPCRELRLSGEVWSQPPVRTARKRFEIAFAAGAPTRDLGPLRVAAAPAVAPEGGPALSLTCEWFAPAGPDPLPPGIEVAGPVEAELRDTRGALCPLLHTVSLDAEVPGGVRRTQKFVWRVPETGRGEVTLSYPTAPRRATPFAMEKIPLPEMEPPIFGRLDAQRMVLNGADAVLDALDLLEPEGPQGLAPHPLLDPEHGGAVRFHLENAEGAPAGSGTIDAALAPRGGDGWGGWHWFSGRTDARGDATLANVRPGCYLVRVRFRPDAGANPALSAAEVEVTIRAGETLALPPCRLRAAAAARLRGARRRTKEKGAARRALPSWSTGDCNE